MKSTFQIIKQNHKQQKQWQHQQQQQSNNKNNNWKPTMSLCKYICRKRPVKGPNFPS